MALETIYSSTSNRRVLWLKQQLQTIKKGLLMIDEYLGQISVLQDALSVSGMSMSNRKIVLITLDGLGEAYDGFATSS